VQRASEQVIDRRDDWRALAETPRTRVQNAEGRDRGTEQYGGAAEGSEGDIRENEESSRNARDLPTVNTPPRKYEFRPPRITNIAAVPSPIIEDKDVGRERQAAEE
jgi:hypothetical protein